MEKNPAILGQVIMWAELLKKPDDMITKYPFLQFGDILTFDIDSGINDDRWLENDEMTQNVVEDSSISELPLFKS